MSRADLVMALERARSHVSVLERALEVIDLYAGAGGNAPGARAPRDRREDAPTRRGRAAEAAHARQARPVETGKGEPPSAPRPSAKRPPRAPRPADIPRGQRWCGTCETVKAVSDFARDTSKLDGLQIRCKPCSQEACRRARAKQAGKTAQTPPKKEDAASPRELSLVDKPARRAPVPGSGEATRRMALIRARAAAKSARRGRDFDGDDVAPELDFEGDTIAARELG